LTKINSLRVYYDNTILKHLQRHESHATLTLEEQKPHHIRARDYTYR